MAEVLQLSYGSLSMLAFPGPGGEEQTSTLSMHAEAEASQDGNDVYLKLNDLVAECTPQLVHPYQFMGPFLSEMSFEATPADGSTIGIAEPSDWPFPPLGGGGVQEAGPSDPAGGQLRVTDFTASGSSSIHVEGSQENITCGADFGGVTGVYRVSRENWAGPKGLQKHPDIPSSQPGEVRYSKWRSITKDSMKSAGFGRSSINHTFKWRKAENARVIGIHVKVEGRVSFLVADRKLCKKPYVYTWKDIIMAAREFKIPVASL